MTDPRDLENAIRDWLDGEVSSQTRSMLNEFLCESDEAAKTFARAVNFHYALREACLEEASLPAAFVKLSDSHPDRLFVESISFGRKRQELEERLSFRFGNFRNVVVLVSVGISLLVLTTWLLNSGLPELSINQPVEPREMARAEGSVSSEEDQVRVVVVDAVNPGLAKQFPVGTGFNVRDVIRFDTGQMTLRFHAGVIVTVTGRVEMEILTPMKSLLRGGRLTATVSEQARGFTVVTPSADVVDLGTQFGVNVNEEGNSEVVVFEGAVDVLYDRSGGNAVRRTQRLSKGEALQLQEAGKILPITVIQRGIRAEDWSTEISDPDCAIVRISDNFIGPGQPTYYGVVPRGFDEDVIAYVDRPFEWNSLLGTPFPEELRGGDYIQMINNLKFVINLQLQVELRHNCLVYVLFDERASPPQWLLQDYELTSHRMGLDECWPNFRRTPYTHDWISSESMSVLGVGPGKDVDIPFQVWKRTVAAGTTVTFGGMLDSPPPKPDTEQKAHSLRAVSMYGIVVVKQDR